MKNWKYYFSALIILVVISCEEGKSTLNDVQTLNWMETMSEISLPINSKFITSFHKNEFGEIVKYKLDSRNVEDFILKYGLHEVKKLDQTKIAQISDIEHDLKYRVRTMNMGDGFYYFYRQDDKYIWNVLLNKNTQELWFEVLYLD